MKEKIEKNLIENLHPEILEIKNNSHLHQGHLGDDGSGETHFVISVKADLLKNLNKLAAHRKINSLLSDEFKNGLHALEIKIL